MLNVFRGVLVWSLISGTDGTCEVSPNCQARNREACVEPHSTCGPCLHGFASNLSRGNVPCEGSGQGFGAIPTIDLGRVISGSADEQKVELAKMKDAALGVGFAFFQNHSLSQELIQYAFSESTAFFQKPDQEKLQFAWADPEENSGYVKVGHEALDEDSDIGDPKESYDMNKEHMLNSSLWNTSAMPRFWKAMDSLKEDILQCYAMMLDLPPHFFQASHNEEWNTLRLLHYLPIREGSGKSDYRVGPHSDYGTVTLLLQDSVGGLQLFDRSVGRWNDVVSPAGAVVVNTADLLMRWTNDHLASTLHRVVGPQYSEEHAIAAQKDRYSIVYFVNPNKHQIVQNLMQDESPKYAPIKSLDYLVQRLSATFDEPKSPVEERTDL